MDLLTHALLGAASGYAITRAHSRMTALAGAAGAVLPGIDGLIGSDTDPLLALEVHGGLTHSFLAAPFGALIVAGALWLALRRKEDFATLVAASLAGYIGAILLDACTGYGVQLAWPFSDRRFAAGIVAVFDPVVTLILLAGVIAALRAATAQSATVAIVLTLVYLGFGWLQHERAASLVQKTAAARGHAIRDRALEPTLGNLLLWRSVYLTPEKQYVVDAVRVGLFTAPVVYPAGTVRHVNPIDLVPPLTLDSVQASDVVRFAKISEGYLARHPSRPNIIGDIRHAPLPAGLRPSWAIEIFPESEDSHVTFHDFSELTTQDRSLFFAMLRGAAPESLATAAPETRGYEKPRTKDRKP